MINEVVIHFNFVLVDNESYTERFQQKQDSRDSSSKQANHVSKKSQGHDHKEDDGRPNSEAGNIKTAIEGNIKTTTQTHTRTTIQTHIKTTIQTHIKSSTYNIQIQGHINAHTTKFQPYINPNHSELLEYGVDYKHEK